MFLSPANIVGIIVGSTVASDRALYHHPHRHLCCHCLLHWTSFVQPPTHNCYSCRTTNPCHFNCRHNKLSTARWCPGLPTSSSSNVPSPIVPLPTTGDDYQTWDSVPSPTIHTPGCIPSLPTSASLGRDNLRECCMHWTQELSLERFCLL